MAVGIVGKKVGMTRCFTEDGGAVPVTVVFVEPNRVTQVKTVETDGYSSIQVASGTRRANLLSKPKAGHFAKAGVEPGDMLCEFRLYEGESSTLNVGDLIKADIFSAGQLVDVRGTSKGKGYAGVIKRYNFKQQPASHGNSLTTRAPGSIGQNQTPGRVFKGRKMAGHMGDARVTVQAHTVFRVDPETNVILIKGSVPGAPGSNVVIMPSVKAQKVGGSH
jgi:large subunit ribosomal protein L3